MPAAAQAVGGVCEVLSPATAARDRLHKRNLYARAGVPHYWLIDPDVRVLEAIALRDGVWVETGVYGDEMAEGPTARTRDRQRAPAFLPSESCDQLQSPSSWSSLI